MHEGSYSWVSGSKGPSLERAPKVAQDWRKPIQQEDIENTT